MIALACASLGFAFAMLATYVAGARAGYGRGWEAAKADQAAVDTIRRTLREKGPAAEELGVIAGDLNDDELAPVVALARRIAAGRKQYGELRLAQDTREWRAELRAELADALAYLEWEARSGR
jgi:hypothetical protein